VFSLLAKDLFPLFYFCCLVCWWPFVVVVSGDFLVFGVLLYPFFFIYYLPLKKNHTFFLSFS